MSALERWRQGLSDSGLGDAEVGERVAVLEAFCSFSEQTPDELVERCVDRERGRIKVKERTRVEELIAQFGALGESDDAGARAAATRTNVVRSFLVHNGVRVLAPRAPWL